MVASHFQRCSVLVVGPDDAQKWPPIIKSSHGNYDRKVWRKPSSFSRCHMESLDTSQKNLTFVQVLGQFESSSNSFSAALDVLAVGQKARKPTTGKCSHMVKNHGFYWFPIFEQLPKALLTCR